ncbi:polyketide cyclase [Planctomonas sp. JC2975]|uniref:SRPBCC family protein n=1 Tax=Planctomonas sp. JC2975 TaxID=2729626 RepID=UPI0014762C89|nr:SRPBCC family protein [Planctomonas sp. JC2975]NNC10278.1 polyketide cyclase [Planctomonas sp. JC2975]
MTDRFITHDTMVLERTYPVPVERVFHAWTDVSAKRVWFTGDTTPGGSGSEYRLDFRVGGHELSRGGMPGGDVVFTYDAEYRDIVENERIVYSSYMLRDDTRISVSLTSVEFRADGDSTRLILTEHGIYLDDEDKPEYRSEGMGAQLDALGRVLTQHVAVDERV